MSSGDALDCSTKCWSIESQIPVELILNRGKQFEQAFWVNQSTRYQLVNIQRIHAMAALDLRQGLSVEVVMIKRELSFLLNEKASFLPSRQFGNKVTGRSKFNVHL